MSSIDLLSVKDLDGFTPCQIADSKFGDSACRGNPNKPGCGPSSEFTRTFTRHAMDTKFATIGPRLQKLEFYKSIYWIIFCFCLSSFISYCIGRLPYWQFLDPYIKCFFVLFTLGPMGFMTSQSGHRIHHPSSLPNPYFKGLP